ncbi:MAG TPA: hypothetical protein VFQ44_06435 [Streptosporangiaceae bacterium]|nr:hypothetical protein [Streptosporangiaceae bacterium]
MRDIAADPARWSFSPRWSFARARRAAAEIRAAPLGDQAIATLRPPGVSGLARSRAPLALLLYLAGLDGQVVEQDSGGFAVLRRPAARGAVRSGGPWLRLLRWLDHHWDLAVFAIPPAAAVVAAALVLPLPVARLGAVLVLFAAMLWVCVFLTGGAVRQLGCVARMGASSPSAESLRWDHWSAPLVHQPDPDLLDDLLRLMTERLAALIRAEVQAFTGHTARASGLDVTETLVILESGISTPKARKEVARSLRAIRTTAPLEGVIMLAPPRRQDQVPARQVAGGGFLLLYLGGLAVVIAVCARFVADTEASACVPASCRGHPVTYLLALRWLGQRLFFTDPAGLSAGTAQATVLGWLVSLAGAMLVAVCWVAARQQITRNRQENSRHREHYRQVAETTRVLILVVTQEERKALLRSVRRYVGQRPAESYDGRRTVCALGSIAGTELMLAQAVAQGTASASGMYETAKSAIDQCRPDHVILTGICFGLRPGDGQRLGDIVVAEEVHNIDHRKVVEDRGVERTIRRGAHGQASPALLDRFQAAASTWDGARVHFGQVLTSSTLVNSGSLVARLRAEFPDALAGEMEGTGVYEAAREGVKPNWIMVKAISDWGCAKTDDHQPLAARNTADFVVHVVATGALRGRL